MTRLNIPFEKTCTIVISSNKLPIKVKSELATTDIELFQALNYRSKKEFTQPLTLMFNNPLAQSFVKLNFSFTTELIAVDYITNKVKKIQLLPAKKDTGDFIQGFSEYSLVILAPKGFSKQHKIEELKTTVKLK